VAIIPYGCIWLASKVAKDPADLIEKTQAAIQTLLKNGDAWIKMTFNSETAHQIESFSQSISHILP
jgi:hypothetical protein